MNCEAPIRKGFLLGITEKNFEEAEEVFPGIASFYEHCRRKPHTFLDLVWQFEKAIADGKDSGAFVGPLAVVSNLAY